MFDGNGVIRTYVPILVRLCLYVGLIAQLLLIQVLGKLGTKDSSKEAKLDRGTRNRWRPTSHREITLVRTFDTLKLTTWLYYAMQPPI
jgi:hypothetical protein